MRIPAKVNENTDHSPGGTWGLLPEAAGPLCAEDALVRVIQSKDLLVISPLS